MHLGMSLTTPAGQQERIAATLSREGQPLARRDRLGEATVTSAFLLAAGALLALDPPAAFPMLPALACVVVLAVSTQVRFHVASGFTVPTQLGFVPLLFAVPVSLVPLAVVAALLLAASRPWRPAARAPGGSCTASATRGSPSEPCCPSC